MTYQEFLDECKSIESMPVFPKLSPDSKSIARENYRENNQVRARALKEFMLRPENREHFVKLRRTAIQYADYKYSFEDSPPPDYKGEESIMDFVRRWYS